MLNRKQKYEQKFKMISFRVTHKEFEHIKKQIDKNDEKITQYIKRVVVNKKTRVPTYMKVKLKVSYELNRIGNNLNQLAKLANSYGDLPTLEQLHKIEKELQRIK